MSCKNLTVGASSPTGMVTPGFLPSRDTCTSLYIVGEGREQDAEASPARIAARTPLLQVCQAVQVRLFWIGW
jgi:hypothetical protein